MVTTLGARLEAVLALDPSAPAIEFGGRWHTWGDLAAVAHGVADAIRASELAPDGAIGLVLRNDPAMVGALVGTLLTGRCVTTINPTQGDEALRGDLVDLRVGVLVATDADWARDACRVTAAASGAVAIVARSAPAAGAAPAGDRNTVGDGVFRVAPPGVAVEMLTSGTTGPPKRVPLAYDAFVRTIGAARSHYAVGSDDDAPRLRRGTAIVNSPLVHMSGLFRTLLNLCEGRSIALLERFELDRWLDLVRRHQPKAVSLVPATLRMVLDADVDPADLASIQVVTSGTAPLSPEMQRAFEERFDLAVLPSYGATEFAGGVAGWTLPLHREWAERKLGSVGRAQPGREIRIVGDDGAALATDETGRIEVRSAGGDWVRTTDLGRLDEDDFLWIVGRSDDAIIRGGFKVFPREIVDALRLHPAVADAGATGLTDDRLGAVPVAAVELRPDMNTDEAALLDHVRAHLTGYKVPTRVQIVDELPRTPSMKVSQPALRALFEDAS